MNACQDDHPIPAANPIPAASDLDLPTRDGDVLEVSCEDGNPPYLVRWTDGHLAPVTEIRDEVDELAVVRARRRLAAELRETQRRTSAH